jgi:cytochrome c1
MKNTRRNFLKSATAAATIAAPFINAQSKSGSRPPIVGSGDFQYEVIHDWGELPAGLEHEVVSIRMPLVDHAVIGPALSRGLDRPQQRRIVEIAVEEDHRGATADGAAASGDTLASSRARTSACHWYRNAGTGETYDTARRPAT